MSFNPQVTNPRFTYSGIQNYEYPNNLIQAYKERVLHKELIEHHLCSVEDKISNLIKNRMQWTGYAISYSGESTSNYFIDIDICKQKYILSRIVYIKQFIRDKKINNLLK